MVPDFLTIAEAARLIEQRELSPVELVDSRLARIEKFDGQLHSFIRVLADQARADARAAESEIKAGKYRGPLHGIPIGLKDIYETAGVPTTGHSKILIDHVPSKLATHEFALGGPSFDLPFPPARNPWNREHIPGGSSSGSAAAVAAGLVRMAMGSDTGGSIRGPAAYCGTIGMKPTYGLVSRRGVFPLSTTLDHCGPLSWTVEDSAIALQVIAGYDPLDPASVDLPVPDFLDGLGQGVEGLRIGLPRHFFAEAQDVSAEVVSAIDRAAETLEKLGAVVEQITLPDYELFNACGRVIMYSEAFAIHEQDYQTRPLDFGLLTYLRMTLGAFVTAADLHQAMRLRRELSQAVNRQLKRYDALITASALAPAPAFADIVPNIPPNWPIQTMPFNVTGNPAMSIPTGFSASGLPLSMQIVGRAFDEGTVLRIGAAFEAATGLSARRPALAEG